MGGPPTTVEKKNLTWTLGLDKLTRGWDVEKDAFIHNKKKFNVYFLAIPNYFLESFLLCCWVNFYGFLLKP